MVAMMRFLLTFVLLLVAIGESACSTAGQPQTNVAHRITAGVREAGASAGFSFAVVLDHRMFYIQGFGPEEFESAPSRSRCAKRSRQSGI